MFKRIDHIEIIPQDMESSIKFYTEILGFRLKMRHKVEAPPLEEVVYLTLGDTMLEFLKVKGPAPVSGEGWQGGYRMMAIEVEDMNKTVDYLREKGIKITWGPADLGRSMRAEIKDVDGIPIELRQWK